MAAEDAFPEAQMPEKCMQLVVDDSATTLALAALAKQVEWVRRHLGAVEAKVEVLQNADTVVKKSDADWTSILAHYHNVSNIEPRIAAVERDTTAELAALKQQLQDLTRRQEQQPQPLQQEPQEQQRQMLAAEPTPVAAAMPEQNRVFEDALRELQDAVHELQATRDADLLQFNKRLDESTQAYDQLQKHIGAYQEEHRAFREQLGRCDHKGEMLEEQLEALQQQLVKLHQQANLPQTQPTSAQSIVDTQLVEQLQQQIADLERKVAEHSKQLAEVERKLERASQNSDNGASRLAGLYRRLDQHDQMLNDLHDMVRSQQQQVPNNLTEEMDLMRSNMTTLQAATAKIHELEESKEDLSERMYSTQQSLAKLASSWQQHVEPEVTALGDRVTDCDARIHDLDAKLNARSQLNREAETALREESKRLDQYATALDSLCKDVLEIDERFKTKLHEVARKFENQLEYTAGWMVKQVKHQIAKRVHEKDVDATDLGRTRCIVCDNPVMKMRRHTPFESDPFLAKMRPKQLPTSTEDLDLLRQNSPPRERLLEDKLKQKQRPATAHPTRGRHTKILTRIDSAITTHVTEQPKQQPEDEPDEHAQTLHQDAPESTELTPIIPIPEAERPTTAPVVHFDARKHVYA